MTIELGILAGVYILTFVLMWFVPRARRREAHATFLFQGLLTWILGLTVVEAGWLNYPVREFQHGTATSFVFEYFAFPIVSAYFNLYYPAGKGWLRRLGYGAAFSAGITVPEILLEIYTDLVEYTGWTWYWTFLSVWATLGASRIFFVWFFRKKEAGEALGSASRKPGRV